MQQDWLEHSKAFYDALNSQWRQYLAQGKNYDPNEHLTEIQTWLDNVKEQWQTTVDNIADPATKQYWQHLFTIYSNAADSMLQTWLERAKEHHNVQSPQELYELWLNACKEAFADSMRSSEYQSMYKDMFNAAAKWWK